MKKQMSDWAVIIVFALIHAATAFVCRVFGLQDDLLLTLLTMTLTMVICVRGRMSSLFIAIAIILINVIGFTLGSLFSRLFSPALASPLILHPLSTFLTTIVIGFSIAAFARLYNRSRNASRLDDGAIWVMLAFLIVIIVRLILVLPLSDPEVRKNSMNVVISYSSSCVALVAFVLYTIRVVRQRDEELARANLAQYRYMSLKQQVNPHFLFNSLNILDCMIQEQSAEQASLYTHKLAEIYRYMIRNEEETIVPLHEEMEFVGKYMSLLQARFTEGLELDVDIPADSLMRRVVPCSIQLLIENATKHNAVSAAKPLWIRIFADADNVCVVNNLCPKVGRPSSTGLGLAYIRQQYMDLSGKEIEVLKTETEFIAKLPLL